MKDLRRFDSGVGRTQERGGRVRRSTAEALAVLLLTLLSLRSGASDAGSGREAHGHFTGDVKPVLYVADVEKSAPYYRDVFGFEFDGFSASEGRTYYAEMMAAGLRFGLHEPMTREQEGRVGKQRLYFRVQDVLLHHERVAAWEGTPGPVRTSEWMDMFVARDPDGNEIVFAATDPARHSINPWGRPATDSSDPDVR